MLRACAVVLITVSAGAQTRDPFFQKGVNFTAERGGYDSPQAYKVLSNLKTYGVNSIALVPYGFNRRGTTTIRFPGGMERDDSIELLSAEAHSLGLKVMLKPQVWTGGGGFPGDLDYPDPAERAQWFASYGKFVDHYAKLATRVGADIFCIGTEFAKLSVYEKDWRNLIRRARNHYRGPLVYAAIQGPEFENLKFWDALDYIGLNNYYPLPDTLATDEIVKKVEAVQTKYRKPVIFPEAGFASLEAPHRAPWDETRRKLSPEDQARAYEALMRGFYNKPWFYGVYWWKIGSNGYGGPNDGSHTPWGKPAMDVVAKWYKSIRRPGPGERP
jgi:hypothetical protein